MNIKVFLAGCLFGMSALSVEAQLGWTRLFSCGRCTEDGVGITLDVQLVCLVNFTPLYPDIWRRPPQ